MLLKDWLKCKKIYVYFTKRKKNFLYFKIHTDNIIITILSSNKFEKKIYIKEIERIIDVKNWEGVKNILNIQIQLEEGIW